jgi:hypothetical protein
MGNVDLPEKNEVKYLGMHLDRRRKMGKAHQVRNKTAQRKSKTNELVNLKINTINRKQTPFIQNNTQTHTGLRNSIMGDSLQF